MSTKLFVDDEEDFDDIRPSPSVNQVHLDDAMDVDEDIDEDDDTIISEIPIVLKRKPVNQKLHILQYPGRPKARPFQDESRIIESRLKPDSNLIEVDFPLKTTTEFHDDLKSEEWGGVSKQTLQGVLIELDGYYAANMKNGELVVIPLDSTAQLRPNLRHIDKEAADKKELHKIENPVNTGVQVVHMTVKNTTDNKPRLGGALLARKKVDEEEFQVLKWHDLNEPESERIRTDLVNAKIKDKLKAITTNEDFVKLLVKDTISRT